MDRASLLAFAVSIGWLIAYESWRGKHVGLEDPDDNGAQPQRDATHISSCVSGSPSHSRPRSSAEIAATCSSVSENPNTSAFSR